MVYKYSIPKRIVHNVLLAIGNITYRSCLFVVGCFVSLRGTKQPNDKALFIIRGCACAYAGSGGSSTASNCGANDASNLISPV